MIQHNTTPSMIPELLAPASNLTAALTAFDCGADAVYIGLQKFNARERGENFTYDDLATLLTFSRKKGRKVYVTLNTLIKEMEIAELVEMLSQLAYLRPDAIIVQDLALIYIVRGFFPELTLHASTQMAIHNSAGVRFAESQGVERVILERQVTMDEVKTIAERTNLELEVFVHGALCCCRSGSCLFSSWLGGWSGNRGKCKQPCRRRFYSDDGNGFFFSTNDLYSLDAIPELKKLGIASLKIEGRLRKADYVRSVVTAYRMMLDADEATYSSVLPKARDVLSGSLGRRWSNGFREEGEMNDVIEHRKLGVSGRLLGFVKSVGKNGFNLSLNHPISLGDRIRIQPESGEEGPAIDVTRLSINGRSINSASSKTVCFVHCDKEVPGKGRVYLIGRQQPDLNVRIADLPKLNAVLDIAITIRQDAVTVSLTNLVEKSWATSLNLAVAEKRPLTADTVRTEFARNDQSLWHSGDIQVDIDGNYFVPAKELKHLRRSFREWLEEAVTLTDIETSKGTRSTACIRALAKPIQAPGGFQPETTSIQAKSSKKGTITAHSIFKTTPHTQEVILPDFCIEAELDRLKSQLMAQARNGITRVRVTSLYGLQLVKEAGLTPVMTAGFPFPVANSVALRFLLGNGVSKATIWVELEKAAVLAMVEKAPGHLELLTQGRIPVLSTRAPIQVEGEIRDDRGRGFTIRREGHLYQLYPEEFFSLKPLPGLSTVRDYSWGDCTGKPTSSLNWDFTLQ